MKTLHLILLLCICLETNAQNASISNRPKNYISIELDPAPFVLGGYSFSLKFSPQTLDHFTFMGSIYSSNFPDAMMSKSNYDRGFRELKINTSYALFADYFIRNNRSGFHFGPSVFFFILNQLRIILQMEERTSEAFIQIYGLGMYSDPLKTADSTSTLG